MTIRLSKIHYPVTVLGPGKRIGIWVQGCSIGCPGCISRDTWNANAGSDHAVRNILTWCRDVAPSGCDGITISGGEPFEQPEALCDLLTQLNSWRDALERTFDILCFSGFSMRHLERRYAHILKQIDVIVPEPFVQGRAPGKLWRGSENQNLIPLTALGQLRYSRFVGAANERRQIQVSVEKKMVSFIGIPGPGDFERMEEAVAKKGVQLGQASWRA